MKQFKKIAAFVTALTCGIQYECNDDFCNRNRNGRRTRCSCCSCYLKRHYFC